MSVVSYPKGMYEYTAVYVVPDYAPKRYVKETAKAAWQGVGKQAAARGHIIFMVARCRKRITKYGQERALTFYGATPEAIAEWAPTPSIKRAGVRQIRAWLLVVRRLSIRACGTAISGLWFNQRQKAEAWWTSSVSNPQSQKKPS